MICLLSCPKGSNLNYRFAPLTPDMDILNIGVGKGYCTQNLAALGCRVSVLDISCAALNKVKNITAGTYLANALHKIPKNHFDIAISFL